MLVPCGAWERPDAVTSQEKNKDDREISGEWGRDLLTGDARVRERLSVSRLPAAGRITSEYNDKVLLTFARSYRHVSCLCLSLCKLHSYGVASWNDYTRG